MYSLHYTRRFIVGAAAAFILTLATLCFVAFSFAGGIIDGAYSVGGSDSGGNYSSGSSDPYSMEAIRQREHAQQREAYYQQEVERSNRQRAEADRRWNEQQQATPPPIRKADPGPTTTHTFNSSTEITSHCTGSGNFQTCFNTGGPR